jgi:thiol-disulfide isomerase/thioredoxin
MNTSTKALIGLMLAGTAGIIIFLFVHLSSEDGVTVGKKVAAARCTQGQQDCLPEVSYVDTVGTAYTTQSLAGKVVVVNFWATWCKPCLKEIPDLSKVYERYKEQGLVILGVMTDDPDHNTLLNFQSDNEMSYPVVRANAEIMRAHRFGGNLPTTYIFDRTGKRIFSKVGALHEAQLVRMLDPLIAQN